MECTGGEEAVHAPYGRHVRNAASAEEDPAQAVAALGKEAEEEAADVAGDDRGQGHRLHPGQLAYHEDEARGGARPHEPAEGVERSPVPVREHRQVVPA